jgi:hypothetical protein
VDFPWLYYGLATGRDVRTTPEYDVDVGCHVLRGEVSYLHSVLRYDYDHVERPGVVPSLAAILASLYRHPNFDYLATDDVRPFVHDVLSASGLRTSG